MGALAVVFILMCRLMMVSTNRSLGIILQKDFIVFFVLAPVFLRTGCGQKYSVIRLEEKNKENIKMNKT
jgi:hypothetical protein